MPKSSPILNENWKFYFIPLYSEQFLEFKFIITFYVVIQEKCNMQTVMQSLLNVQELGEKIATVDKLLTSGLKYVWKGCN